jgi:hypothetical protein
MLEYIVRPFQAPNAHGTIVIPSTPKESTETAILTWGGESTLPDVQYTEVGFNTKKNREDFTELNRDAETVRITGNDPENWIDVARSKKLYLDKDTGEDLSPSDASQNDWSGSTALADLPPGTTITIGGGAKKTKATMSLNNNTAAPG